MLSRATVVVRLVHYLLFEDILCFACPFGRVRKSGKITCPNEHAGRFAHEVVIRRTSARESALRIPHCQVHNLADVLPELRIKGTAASDKIYGPDPVDNAHTVLKCTLPIHAVAERICDDP